MKAITLYQPWASLLVAGVKRYETRSWPTKYRGPLAIHAAQCCVKLPPLWGPDHNMTLLNVPEVVEACVQAGLPTDLDWFPYGAMVGEVWLTNVRLTAVQHSTPLRPIEMYLGDFSAGRYAWECVEHRRYETPVPARGHQRIWNWEEVRR